MWSFWGSGLPLGSYDVRVASNGFDTQLRSRVELSVAENRWIDFVLTLSVATNTVEVRSQASGIELRETSLGTTFTSRDIDSLPINGRDYARFSLLASGALSRSNQIADLSFNGLFSVHNQFSIDGVDATRVDQPYLANGFERGARLLTGSLESISEFRVETSGYQAEYGRAASASLNIATKTGTNDLHGSAFGYLRNQRLDARNFFNTKPSPQIPFTYTDFGASANGPIRRNATFFSVNYEGSRQQLGVLGSGTVPSELMRTLALQTSPVLAPLISALPAGTAPSINPLVDFYSVAKDLAVREDTGSAKVNHTFNTRASAYARINVNDSHVNGPLFANQPAALGLMDLQDVPVRVINLAIGGQLLLSSRAVNEVLFGIQNVDAALNTSAAGIPLVSITGVSIQPGDRGNSATLDRSVQLGNTLSFQTGSHLIKAGAEIRHQALWQSVSSFQLLTYTSLNNFVNNRLADAVIGAENPGSRVSAYEGSAFAQDTWRATRSLTIDYGLRYDLFAAPFDPTGHSMPFDPRVGSLVAAGSAYFHTNRLNLAPRFGFAWEFQPSYVLRGGYGLFYDAYPPGFGDLSGNSRPGNTTLLAQSVPGLSYPVNSFIGSGGGTTPLPSVSGFEWNKPDLYTEQWNLSIDHQIGRNTLIRSAYIGNRGVHLRRNLNINLVDPTLGSRPNPNYADINIETASGNSWYDAAELTGTHSFGQGFAGSVHYTWSHALDDVTDPAVLGTSQPQDNRNFAAEKGSGSGDARHRLQLTGVYDLPLGNGKLGRGWQLSGTVQYRTGIATTVFIGINTAGTGNLVNQRPNAVPGVDPYPASQSVDGWFNPGAFASPAPGTFGNLARGSVVGPSLAEADLSLRKDYPIDERRTLQLRFDLFNVLNHPNFAQPNTTFGTTSFGTIFQTAGNTIGLGTSRQVEVVLRLMF